MEPVVGKKQIMVKLGFTPRPTGWTKTVTPVVVNEGTTVEEFFQHLDTLPAPAPWREYPSRQLNGHSFKDAEMSTLILHEEDIIFCSGDISGNDDELCDEQE